MKGQNRKLVISLFISIIAICYVSLAISYAWFFANRAQDNSANNLKIVDFNGDIFHYKDNYIMKMEKEKIIKDSKEIKLLIMLYL